MPAPHMRADEHLGWANVEGFSGRVEEAGDTISVDINALGARGPEYSPIPALEVTRVLLLGDSYAWGYGVDNSQTAAAVMERQDPALEVINLAVSGFSTDQELLLFEQVSQKLHADIVVLLTFSNDMTGNIIAADYAWRPKPRFVLRHGELEFRPRTSIGPLGRMDIAGKRHSALYTTAAFTLRTAKIFPFPLIRSATQTAAAAWRDEPRRDPARLMAALIRRLRLAVEDTGAQLVVVAAANQDQIQKNTDTEFRDTIARICREQDLPYLDLGTRFQREYSNDPDVSLSHAHDDHWNALANRVVAAAMREFLIALELLP